MSYGYYSWEKLWEKVKNMLPEEKIRWISENECSCHVVEGWWDYRNHFSNCPLENPNCEMWAFYEGVEDGFIYPK